MKKSYSQEEIEVWEKLATFNHVFARSFTIEDHKTELKMHTHDMGLMTCVKKGIVRVATANDSWLISGDTIFYIPPDLMHVTEMIGDCEILGVVIPQRLIKLLPKNISFIEFSPLLMSILERMTTWEFSLDYNPEQQRLARVAEDELRNAKEAIYFHIPMPKDEKLLKIARKILQSPEDMSTVQNWATVSGMSVRSFTRHFVDETGLGFSEWRQRVKIYTALKMLSSNVPVTEVSFNLGYQNVSTFIAMFKAKMGKTPTEYVRQVP